MSGHENDASADLASTAGQGGALAHDAVATPAAAQRAPDRGRNDASDEDRIAGIVAQTRADVGGAGVERIADVLRQRFDDAGIVIDADRTVALAAEIDQS